MTNSIFLQSSKGIQGSFTPPGDKSVSHRALMLGALASGKSSFTNFLEAEDCLSTMKAMQAMGVTVEFQPGRGEVSVNGNGLNGLKAPSSELYLGNSGTSMRLLMGILAGQKFETILTGDKSLSQRPMQRVTQPLKQMGAQIKGRDNGNYAPLTIHGGRLKGIDFENRLSSAQVKSAILLAGLFAEGETRVTETVVSRDHTERFLCTLGAPLRVEGKTVIIEKTESLKAIQSPIPGDISSAAFFITGAAMTPGSDLIVRNVGLNPTRTGLLRVLERMGAKLEVTQTGMKPEPMGDIHVSGARLTGTSISATEIPSLVDELPVIMVAMAVAEGESMISGARELRVKETDRIFSMTHNIQNIGGKAEELPDGCVIQGVEKLQGGMIKSFDDHRTVMSFAIASLACSGELEIDDITSVATSYPGFFRQFEVLKKV